MACWRVVKPPPVGSGFKSRGCTTRVYHSLSRASSRLERLLAVQRLFDYRGGVGDRARRAAVFLRRIQVALAMKRAGVAACGDLRRSRAGAWSSSRSSENRRMIRSFPTRVPPRETISPGCAVVIERSASQT